MWHAHANRALDLYRCGLLRRERAEAQIETARERMKSLPCPAYFWLTENDALQPGAIDRVIG